MLETGEMYQKITGFGGAFTDAAGLNILSLPPEMQDTVLRCWSLSFVSFPHLCTHWLGFSHWIIHSCFLYWLTHSLSLSLVVLTHSFTHSLLFPLTHSFTLPLVLLTHLLTPASLTHSFSPSCFAYSLFLPLQTQSSIHSLTSHLCFPHPLCLVSCLCLIVNLPFFFPSFPFLPSFLSFPFLPVLTHFFSSHLLCFLTQSYFSSSLMHSLDHSHGSNIFIHSWQMTVRSKNLVALLWEWVGK